MSKVTDLVQVEDTGIGYVAVCQEHGDVALKQTDDDAHLAAARHLARVHVPGVQPPPRRHTEPGCEMCDTITAMGGFGPAHAASRRCESGGYTHCTCDACF